MQTCWNFQSRSSHQLTADSMMGLEQNEAEKMREMLFWVNCPFRYKQPTSGFEWNAPLLLAFLLPCSHTHSLTLALSLGSCFHGYQPKRTAWRRATQKAKEKDRVCPVSPIRDSKRCAPHSPAAIHQLGSKVTHSADPASVQTSDPLITHTNPTFIYATHTILPPFQQPFSGVSQQCFSFSDDNVLKYFTGCRELMGKAPGEKCYTSW